MLGRPTAIRVSRSSSCRFNPYRRDHKLLVTKEKSCSTYEGEGDPMSRVLLLNSAFAPHKVIAWEHAITMIYTHKVEVIETTDEVIYTSPSTGEIVKMPSVVRLCKPITGMKRAVKFSRVNVFTRDSFRCCYCGSQKRMSELNYDHVLPRHLGGRTVWDNIVAACYPCNSKKSNRTPEQAGMKLLKRPYKPKSLPLVGPRFDPKDIPPEWATWVTSYFQDSEVA